MKMKETINFLDRSYFYDKNMRKNYFVELAGNCYEQLYSIILKNTDSIDYDIVSLCIRNITFNLLYDDDKMFIRSSVRQNFNAINKDFCDYQDIVFRNNGNAAMDAMDEQIDRYGYAIFRTVDNLLPFTIYYEPNFDINNFIENGHVMLMVGYDKENYYFVDQLAELDKHNFVSVPSRSDIGIYKREDFKKVFDLYLCIKPIRFNYENIKNSISLALKVISASSEDYYDNKALTDRQYENVTAIGGRSAVKFINEFLMESGNNLSSKTFDPRLHKNSPFDMQKELINGFTGIINARKVLLEFLLHSFNSEDVLINKLKRDIYTSQLLKNQIIRNYQKGFFDTGVFYKPYCDDWLESEDALFSELKIKFSI